MEQRLWMALGGGGGVVSMRKIGMVGEMVRRTRGIEGRGPVPAVKAGEAEVG